MNVLLTLAEAAERLRVSVRTLEREVRDGRLTPTIVEGRRFVSPGHLEQYIALNTWSKLPPKERKLRQHRLAYPDPELDALLDIEKIAAGKTAMAYNGPAIYFLFRGDELVYIGQAVRLLGRIGSHEHAFDAFAYIPCAFADLNKLERRAILKYRPPLNKL